MKKLILLRTALIFLCAFPAFESAAQDHYQAIILPKWQPGDEFTYRFTKETEEYGKTPQSEWLNVQVKILEKNAEGYVLRWEPLELAMGEKDDKHFTFDEFKILLAYPQDRLQMWSVYAHRTLPFTFKTDTLGQNPQIIGADTLISGIRNRMESLLTEYQEKYEEVTDVEVNETRAYMNEQVLDEAALTNSLLQAFALAVNIYGVEVSASDTIVEYWELPSQLMPDVMIETTYQYYIKSYDTAAEELTIGCIEEQDPAQLNKIAKIELRNNLKNVIQDKKEIETKLNSYRLDYDVTYNYVLRVSDNVVLESEYNKIVTTILEDKAIVQTEHYACKLL